MRVPFRLVDVFAESPFGGNQLCVVPEVPGVDGDLMLALTRELGFSETTFVTAVRPSGYDVRIFTPEKELPFAGHPTLGTAFTLVREGLTRRTSSSTAPRVTSRCACIWMRAVRGCDSCSRSWVER
jgi:trans-2,3-dihydro-3-hydroxyanthranilate isomerase